MVWRNHRNVKCTTRRLLLLYCCYLLTPLCKTEKCNPRKNMTDQGPIFTRLCCSCKPKSRSVQIPVGIIVHPRQRHKKSFVWGGGRDSPFHIYSSVSSCNHLIQNLGSNLHWKWGDQGGSMVGPSGETRKSRSKAWPGLIRWVMRISCAITLALGVWIWNKTSTHISLYIVGQTKTYLSFHKV